MELMPSPLDLVIFIPPSQGAFDWGVSTSVQVNNCWRETPLFPADEPVRVQALFFC